MKPISRDWRALTLVSFGFFILTTLAAKHNEICCMFSSCRYYGFPGTFLSLCKTTDLFPEAKLVEQISSAGLLQKGWSPSFNTRLTDFLPSAHMNLFVDAAFAALLAWLALRLIDRLSKTIKSDSK